MWIYLLWKEIDQSNCSRRRRLNILGLDTIKQEEAKVKKAWVPNGPFEHNDGFHISFFGKNEKKAWVRTWKIPNTNPRFKRKIQTKKEEAQTYHYIAKNQESSG